MLDFGAINSTSSFRVVQETVGTAFSPLGVNNAGQDTVNGQQEIWVQVLEEAAAQLYTPAGQPISAGYSVIGAGGFPSDAMEALTGRTATLSAGMPLTTAQLVAEQAIGALVVFGTSLADSWTLNLVADHAYAFESVTPQGMVQLYNPWGFDQPAAMSLTDLATFLDTPVLGYVGSVSVSTPTGVSVSALGVINLTSMTGVTILGNNLQVVGGQYDSITVNGNSNTLTFDLHAQATYSGYSNWFYASLGFFVSGASSSGVFLGNWDTIYGGVNGLAVVIGYGNTFIGLSGDTLSVSGNSNTIALGSSGNATIYGTSNTVIASGGSVMLGNYSSVSILGSNDTIISNPNGGTADIFAIAGNDDHVNAGPQSAVFVAGNDAVVNATTLSNICITGNTAIVHLLSGGLITATGVNEEFFTANATVRLSANSTAIVLGSGNTVTGLSGDTIIISGKSNALTLGSGSKGFIYGTANTVTASGDSVTLANNASAFIGGSNDWIIGGKADIFGFRGGFTNVVIADFLTAGTAHDVVDFYGNSVLNSYANVMSHATQAGANVVISDGHNYAVLASLNKSSLTASNFMFSNLPA